jgi:hypothetical protein
LFFTMESVGMLGWPFFASTSRGSGCIKLSVGIRRIRMVWMDESPSVMVFSSSVTYLFPSLASRLGLKPSDVERDLVTLWSWESAPAISLVLSVRSPAVLGAPGDVGGGASSKNLALFTT